MRMQGCVLQRNPRRTLTLSRVAITPVTNLPPAHLTPPPRHLSVAPSYRVMSLHLDRLAGALQAPNDAAVPVLPNEIDGANVWLLNELATIGNFTVQCESVHEHDDCPC